MKLTENVYYLGNNILKTPSMPQIKHFFVVSKMAELSESDYPYKQRNCMSLINVALMEKLRSQSQILL